MKLKLVGIVILLVGIVILYALGRTLIHNTRRANLYAAGEAAAEAGHWPEAFAQFYALAELDPHYRDVDKKIEEALDQTLRQPLEELDVTIEIAMLRQLAASGELATLAEVLDQRMVYIPAGEFTMGSDTAHEDERPERQVYLDAFELDRYEVTNVQYQRFLQRSGEPAPRYWLDDIYPTAQADYPVVGVSWSQAKAYCEWAGKRLPTEAEWEKACRGSNGNVFPWGNAWEPQRANVGYTQAQNWPLRLDEGWALLQSTAPSPDVPRLQPVGGYPEGQSAYEILDLTGNVSEWVADWYNWSGYWDMSSRNPIGVEPPWNHSIRGSGWFDRRGCEDLIQDLSRCSSRNSSHSYDDPRLGFRCAR